MSRSGDRERAGRELENALHVTIVVVALVSEVHT